MIQSLISRADIARLKLALAGRTIAFSFGSGVDSTAALVLLHLAGIRPDFISFADTGGEKKVTIEHLHRMQSVMARWGWPQIEVCRKVTLPSTPYNDLYGNCVENETLPSLAFGMKSCSIKWKQDPQDYLLMGAKSGPNKQPAHPVWEKAQRNNERVVKILGYDAGPADLARAAKLTKDKKFDFYYPLQVVQWKRQDCVNAITEVLGADYVPVKSACFFCPASKVWELYWLAAEEPDLLQKALVMERTALTGRHSRFDTVEFGDTWEALVLNADSFPSSKTTVGLGRSFAWNQWARVNNVVDADFNVLRSAEAKAHFLSMSEAMRVDDNALDQRTKRGGKKKVIPVYALAA